MRISLVSIGNSKGVRIPKAILEQCHFKRKVDLEVDGNMIVLRPLKKKPRQGWSESFKLMHQNSDDRLLIKDSLDISNEDWQW